MARLLAHIQARLDIRWLANGALEYEWMEPDTRKHGRQRLVKWRSRGSGTSYARMTWDQLNDLEYAAVTSKGAVQSPQGPVSTLIGKIKYIEHCIAIRNKRAVK